MENGLFTNHDLEQAYQCALQIKDRDERNHALVSIARAAKDHEFAAAKTIVFSLEKDEGSFWALLELFQAGNDSTCLDAAADCLATLTKHGADAKEDDLEIDSQFLPPTSIGDLALALQMTSALQRNELDTARKLLYQIFDPMLYARSLGILYRLTRDQQDLEALLQLKVVMKDEPPDMLQSYVLLLISDATGDLDLRQERYNRLLRLVELHAPEIIIQNAIALLVKTGDFETARRLMPEYKCSEKQDQFVAAFAIGHAARNELAEARALASRLPPNMDKVEAYTSIFSALTKDV